MRSWALVICTLLSSQVFAWCEPIHGPDAPVIRLGSIGAETLQKAWNAANKVKGGAVIEVPAGTYSCQTVWAASRNQSYENVTIRGIRDEAGKRPVMACASGTWLAIGPPMHQADGTTPAPAVESAVMVQDIEVSGWGSWMVIYNTTKAVILDSHMHHAGGKGIRNSERLGPTQRFAWEICGSEFSHAGQGNIDHPIYTHGGHSGGFGSIVFDRSYCHHSRGSHCLKTTANDVRVTAAKFSNPCDEPGYCGTEVLDITSAANSVVSGNLFESALQVGVAMTYMLNREYDPPRDSGPLYTPYYDSAQFKDEAWWNMIRAQGIDDALPTPASAANPHLRKHFWSNNHFRNLGQNTNRPFVSIYGTYPIRSVTYASNCVQGLPVPANWHELSRLYVANNTWDGPAPATPFYSGLPNFCGQPLPPQMVRAPIIDAGGNRAAALPAWFKN